MAPVRQDSPHRPGPIPTAAAPGAPALPPAQGVGQKARPTSTARPIGDGFDPSKARNLISRPSDTFKAFKAAPGPKRAYASLATDQRARYDQLLGAAQADPINKAKAVKQVQSLLGPDGGFKHYDLVDKALQGQTGDRAGAPAALRQLLFNGRLTQGGKGPLQQNALEHLGLLAAQQRTPTGLDSHALAADVVLDLAHPNRIKQGTGNQDCGGTAAAVIAAKGRPAEYARIVTELGTKGTTRVGNELWTASKPKGGVDERSQSQRLFAATYVEQTNDPTIAPTTDAQMKGLLNGEYGSEMAKGLRSLTGRNYQAAFIPTAQESNLVAHGAAVAEGLTALAQHLEKGAPIALNVDHHWVVATGATGPQGQKLIHVADGSGHDDTISVRDLRNRIQGFVFDDAISSVPMDMRRRRYDKPGIGGDGAEGTQPIGSRSRNNN
ncbi:MAG TPA: hypothetical protein VIG99_18170 [Myxococcaceae bacterium]|jgi:hypothetical protein